MGRYCPSSYTATLQRIQFLGCDQRYKYHCMRNKMDIMVEKCIEISWIQEGKCAVYDTHAQLIDSWKCNGTRGVCPQKQYLSNEVMSYSACVPLYTPTNVTDGSNENTSKIPNDGSRFDNNNTRSVLWILVFISTLIAVISVLLIIWIYIRRTRTSRRRTSEATKRKKEENGLFDHEEEILLTIRTGVSEKHESTIEETRHDKRAPKKPSPYKSLIPRQRIDALMNEYLNKEGSSLLLIGDNKEESVKSELRKREEKFQVIGCVDDWWTIPEEKKYVLILCFLNEVNIASSIRRLVDEKEEMLSDIKKRGLHVVTLIGKDVFEQNKEDLERFSLFDGVDPVYI